MPGQKGESGKRPSQSRSEGAYAHSTNYMGGADTNNMQGWNSMDGSKSKRGGQITNSNAGYGNGGNGGGGMRSGSDY